MYGIDWLGPPPKSNDFEIIEVPENKLELNPLQLIELQRTFDPMEQCDNLGVSLYPVARAFVHACV